jgi:hypothetical protein
MSTGKEVTCFDHTPQTHTHIRARPHKRIGHGIDQLARNTKIANLDVSLGIDENVGWFDVCALRSYRVRRFVSQWARGSTIMGMRPTSMHNPVFIVQVRETTQDGLGDLAHNLDLNRPMFLVNPIQRPVTSASIEPVSLSHPLHPLHKPITPLARLTSDPYTPYKSPREHHTRTLRKTRRSIQSCNDA